jgi:hypothetical protein
VHKPVDRLTRAVERQPIRSSQRHHAEIDVRRKPPVERDLGTAGLLASIERREVQIGKTHRLLQFVDVGAGEEHPRHMCLAGDDLCRCARVAVGTAKQRDLVGKRRNHAVALDRLRRHGMLHRSISSGSTDRKA